jgi:cell division protein FtsB
MAKNRKHQSAAIRFGPALKAFLLCLLIGGSGVGYVWQKNQIDQLGQQIRKREIHLKELQDQNEKLRRQMAYMKSPPFLEARIKELNLGLVPPQPSQVWYLKEPTPESNKQSRELAARQSTPVAMNE